MEKVLFAILLAQGAHRACGFQLQPLSSVTQIPHRSSAIVTPLFSSFSDLSGRDEADDKIQIMLDSLDSLKIVPKEPEPVEGDPMDDMVEKMAMPLKFFKGKEVKKDEKIVAADNGDSDTQDTEASDAGDAAGSRSSDDVEVKAGESPAATPKSPIDGPPASPVPPELPSEVPKAPLESSAPSVEAKPAVAQQDVPPKNEKPSAVVIDETSSPAQTTKTAEIQQSSTEPQPSTAEQKTTDGGLLQKIFDRPQVIDQPADSQSQATNVVEGKDSEAPTDGNFKALIQAIQPPALPSIAPPHFGSVEFSLVGGAIVITSLYLALAAHLKGVDKDEGYAEWDQYKRKDVKSGNPAETEPKKDTVTDMNAAAGAIKDASDQSTPYGLRNKGQNPFVKPISSNAINGAAKSKSVSQPPPPSVKSNTVATSDPPKEDAVSAQLERLNKLERDAASVESIIAGKVIPSSSGSIEVQKIEEYCEPNKVNSECSESISSYLDSVSKQQVEEGTQQAAARTIISYLDSLSSNPTKQQEPAFSGTVPTKSKIVAKKEPSRTSAAFSSYLDALSSGSVQEAPSAEAVAGYLNVLSTESKSNQSTTSQKVDNRIEEVEDRLNRLESSVASLPDNIASRLIEWQSRQDQKVNDEIEKIKTYLMNEKAGEEEKTDDI